MRNVVRVRVRGHYRTDLIPQLSNTRPGQRIHRLAVPPVVFLDPDLIDDRSLAISERVIRAYHLSREGDPSFVPDGLWESTGSRFHGPFREALESRDPRPVAEILAGFFGNEIAHGLNQGRMIHDQVRRDPWPEAMLWQDRAISLGIATGHIPAWNPEQGIPADLLKIDSAEIVAAVASEMGIDPAPPQLGGLMGVLVGGKVIPWLALLHIYTAQRIKALLPAGRGHVVEIGGGVGLLAWYNRVMGVATTHTIYDLPIVSALQAYYLLRSERGSEVRLFGEDPSGGTIFLQPGFMFKTRDQATDLLINQDSLPEMDPATRTGYLQDMKRITPLFLSINQEACALGQGWVTQACRRLGGFTEIYRVPYWMRKGYVEELYRINGHAD